MVVEIICIAKDKHEYRGLVNETYANDEQSLRKYPVAGDPIRVKKASPEWVVFDDTTRQTRWQMFSAGSVYLGDVKTDASTEKEALAEAFVINRFVRTLVLEPNPSRTKRIPLGEVTLPSAAQGSAEALAEAQKTLPGAIFCIRKGGGGTKADRPPSKNGKFYIVTVTDAPNNIRWWRQFVRPWNSTTEFGDSANPASEPGPENLQPLQYRKRRYRLRLETLTLVQKQRLWNKGRVRLAMADLAFVDKETGKVFDGDLLEKYTITPADELQRARDIRTEAQV